MTQPSTPRLRIRLNSNAEWIVRSGHPWIFADSIRDVNRPGVLGELAVVYDRYDEFLAVGLFDPLSPIRVRVLHRGKPLAIDAAWWERTFATAVETRRALFDEYTTGYRIIHGENDSCPGLVLDRYADVGVIKLYTPAWLPRLPELLPILQATTRLPTLVLRLSRNIQEIARDQFHRHDGECLTGNPLTSDPIFLENGLRFEAAVIHGQKTGFFLDQRENRMLVETLVAGRTVLNAFSFSGGFSLYAARGGATAVTDLDISAHALAAGARNFALNSEGTGVAACPRHAVQADAFAWLQDHRSPQFDLVVLDPPSLARREAERAGATEAYGRLAFSGLNILRPGGILVAASCSAHVSDTEFFEAVRAAVRRTRRPWRELRTTHHPADHPATFREAHYLKCIYLQT